MKVLNNLDLANNQLLNAKLQNLGSDITAAGNTSVIFYNTATNLAKISNGSTIDTVTNVLESVSVATANGLSVAAVSAKNQAFSLALASGGAAGAMSSSDFTKLGAATNANTFSTIVMRDASGNFTATTITAALTGTASNASNLNNQAASFYLDRTNHTNTQLAATISDFNTAVRTNRLDQMAAPISLVSFNSQKITSLGDPSNPQDAATKNYVDSVATGLDVKASVRFASTANIAGTYTATGGTSLRGQLTAMPNTAVDGVTPVAGNRVLLKNQTSAAQNGIWVVTTLGTGANGVWDRATDFDQDAEVTSGAFTFVEEGTTQATTSWVLSTANPIIIGGASGTNLTISQFGGGQIYTAGNGINLGGNSFSVKVDTTTTNPNSLSVGANGVTIATTYVGQASITTLGTVTTGTWQGTAVATGFGGTGATTVAGAKTNLGFITRFAQTLSTSATSYAVTHSLGTVDVDVVVREVSSNAIVLVDVVTTDANTVTLTFATAPSSNAYRVSIFG